MKELVKAVKQWGINKGLHKVGHLAQAEYTLKEVAELLDAYADKDLPAINDAIGDILVTLIVGASNDELSYSYLEDMLSYGSVYDIRPSGRRSFFNMYTNLLTSIFELKYYIERNNKYLHDRYKNCVSKVLNILEWSNFQYNQSLSLKDCLQLAYNEIKDRKGHTDENGHFIKEN